MQMTAIEHKPMPPCQSLQSAFMRSADEPINRSHAPGNHSCSHALALQRTRFINVGVAGNSSPLQLPTGEI